MTTDDKGGDGRDSLPPGLRQALEQLLEKHIAPLREAIHNLEALYHDDASRELIKLKTAVNQCEEEVEKLRYENAELETNTTLSTDLNAMLKQRIKSLEDTIADLQFSVSMLLSRSDNEDS